ncbi:FixH family protein [Noviherbaspirillum denitrificans]|uniref:Cytochrome oxidase assembly protein n=1 Tax=Noviherbaspirillum denitrificans TaxID=1968433 RepID=A0A254TGM0_9BURK|nr:FixH family protein [Noviherbaspirillum denitrificans]OWW21675.1 cytochrome oxidase assembly protein [Noviherbaspirillum denitrificans]
MQSAAIPNKMTTHKPWYKHRWPWFLMLGPALVVAAGCYTAYLAFSNQDALVVDDYYKQGKAINQDLSRDRKAAAMGMDAALRYEPASGQLVGVISSQKQPFSGKLHVSLVHSTQPLKDLKLDTWADQKGKFAITIPLLDIARWQVVVEGEQRDWRLAGEWLWPQQQQVELQADQVAQR